MKKRCNTNSTFNMLYNFECIFNQYNLNAVFEFSKKMAVFTIYQNAQGCRKGNQANFTHLALLNIFLKEKFRVVTFPGSSFGDTTIKE